SETAKAMMRDYHMGTLSETSRKILNEAANGERNISKAGAAAEFLQPKAWKKAVLLRKDTVSWNTRLFHFELDHPNQTLGLPIGHPLMVRPQALATKETIIRSYPPISETRDKGVMPLLVKVYFRTPSSPGGQMTTAMDALDVGSHLSFKGPIGKF